MKYTVRAAVLLAALLIVALLVRLPRNLPEAGRDGGSAIETVAVADSSARNARRADPRKAFEAELASWRRGFAHVPASAGGPAVPGHTILLTTHEVDTSVSDKASARAQIPTARGTLPYILQFEGSVRDEWKAALEKHGVILRGYLPDNAFLAEVEPGAVADLRSVAPIRWVGVYRPDYKIQPFLRHVADRIAARRADDVAGDAELPRVRVLVQTLAPDDAARVAEDLSRLNASVHTVSPGRRWGLVKAEIEPTHAMLDHLASRADVEWVEEAAPRRLLNDFAVRGDHMNVTNVWNVHGLTGRRQVIGHADTGLDSGALATIHPDFAGRVRLAIARGRPGDWGDPDGHGTHTAGSILGDGAASAGQFSGVAFEADLVHQSVMDAGGGLGGLPDDLYDLYLEAYTNSARIHSDSWGAAVFGQYTVDSRSSDEFMWDYRDMLLVFSAGNEGIDANQNGVVDPDSIGAPATAKNLLTVGAAESDRAAGTGGYSGYSWGYAWPSDYPADPIRNDYISQSADGVRQGMAAFSSRGPTDDGRFKPDIVAPGTDIVSVRSRRATSLAWGAHPNTNYMFSGGTSMSTPLVAGAAALARQFHMERRGVTNPSAALVKATLLNGARSLTPGQYGTNATREIPPLPRPNNVEGWGQTDMERALFPASPVRITACDSNALATGQTNTHALMIVHTNMCRVTLAYSDYPSTAGAGKKLVNDLDMLVLAPNGSNFFPNGRTTPDRTNNVEGVDFAPPVTGVYTVRVSGFNVPNGPQPYAVLFSGGWAPIHGVAPQNTTNTVDPYPVDATITTLDRVDTNTLLLFWNTNASSRFATGTLARVTEAQYRGVIPPQAQHSRVYYYFEGRVDGTIQRYPTNAPASLLSFRITPPVTLTVTGAPAEAAAPQPAYGVHAYASGVPITASVAAISEPVAGARYAGAGWLGSGSVPASGSVQSVAFTITNDSLLSWQWTPQFALSQSSSVAGILNTTSWWNAAETAASIAAVAEASVGGTNYRFAHWLVDGARRPDATNRAVNPATGLLMAAPRNAVSVYVPAAQDSDGNGLPDWWEYSYFGNTGVVVGADADGDGFVNNTEFLDASDPRDSSSVPMPPAIAHAALSSMRTSPAPWHVAATVTDSGTVASVTLAWRRNGGLRQEVAMTTAGASLYTNAIPAPGTNGDSFAYEIVATDGAGLQRTNGPHSLFVLYPVMNYSPTNMGQVWVQPGGIVTQYFNVANAGSMSVSWSVERVSLPTNDAGWWSISPTGGVLTAARGTNIAVLLTAAGLTNGSVRNGTLVLRSNDPLRPSNSVPLRMDVGTAPAIVPVDAPNTTNTVDPYPVDAAITPLSLVNTNAIFVLWNTNGPSSGFATSAMTRVSGDLYRATIPPQPAETRVYYYYRAAGTNGLTSVAPANVPDELLDFDVTIPAQLVVTGTPLAVGAVDPGYGVYTYPSGTVVVAESVPEVLQPDGSIYVNTGWVGSGSVPAFGDTQTVSFVLSGDSELNWQWSFKYALGQTSTAPSVVWPTTFWEPGSAAESLVAPASYGEYRLGQWELDGNRQPATGVAANPVTNIVMTTNRVALARYFPEDQDSDGDGLPDWWEAWYGPDIVGPADDPDLDGFANLLEFQDESDPLDSNSVPTAPVIVHAALAAMRTNPAPWDVAATVTDNATVASVVLAWTRNGGARQEAAMTHAGDGVYTNAIPAPGTFGDSFTYEIVATDGAGLQTTNGPRFLFVSYPAMGVAPEHIELNWLRPGDTAARIVTITNGGNAALNWSLAVQSAGFRDEVEQGAGEWTHGGAGDLWRVSTNRSYSPTHAWYAGNYGEPGYDSGMNCWLQSPPVHVLRGARLEFRYWSDTEIDENNAPYAFDGVVVEISTTGVDFVQLVPEGGYPCVAYGLYGSPFAAGTPVFAGTGGWQHASCDLSAYAGQTAWIRFRFGSDEAYTVGEGWYVDDIVLTPVLTTGSWVAVSVTNGALSGGRATNVTVGLDAAGLVDGDRLGARLVVSGNDPITQAAVVPVSLLVGEPVSIVHEALQNTTNEVDDYIVSAVLQPNGMFDTNGMLFELLWNTAGVGFPFATNTMAAVGVGSYEVAIPAQPLGADVYYYLRFTGAGMEVVHPTNAPAVVHAFAVTAPVTLDVSGSPEPLGEPAPGYGAHVFAAGTFLSVVAPDVMNGGVWLACTGWVGSGSASISGDTNAAVFVISMNSTIEWQWETRYRLAQSSVPGGIVATTSWFAAGSVVDTVTAEPAVNSGGVERRFGGWTLNGARQAGPTGRAVNPVSGIVMTSAWDAVASYYPTTQDDDVDGLPDWWEHFYFGGTASGPTDDPDMDGFDNRTEYMDGSDPTDPASLPQAPTILHAPLADPQTSPAPWLVSAVVTDNVDLAEASIAGSALVLNGASDYALRNPVSGFPTSAITVEFWMKSSDKVRRGTPFSYAVSGDFNDANEFTIYNYNTFLIYRASQSTNTRIGVTDGQWHHVAVTWRSSDGDTRLYRDGELAWQGPLAPGVPLRAGGILVLGQDQDSFGGTFSGDDGFEGRMDELRVWNVVRSADQILGSMSNRLVGTEPGLVSYWRMDEGAGATAYDAMPAGNHLTLAGPRWTNSDAFFSADVQLGWNRNSNGWQYAVMSAGTAGQFSGSIPAPGVNGDRFEYQVVARDVGGVTATNGPHAFSVTHPAISVSPGSLTDVWVLPAALTNRTMIVSNAGSGSLTWAVRMESYGFSDDVESGTNGWSHRGANEQWHISAKRSVSPSRSWYSGSEEAGTYLAYMDGYLDTPAIPVAPGSRLTFTHWADLEMRDAAVSWDGGVVEISTNGGASFARLTPVGGYPYIVNGGFGQPLPGGSGVFAGWGGWTQAVFELAAYGGSEAILRFRMGSDLVNDYPAEGWFVDDVTVSPLGGASSWLSLSVTNGVLLGGEAVAVTLNFDATGMASGESVARSLVFASSDPGTPTSRVPVVMHVAMHPSIAHTPYPNTSTTSGTYAIEAEITPDAFVNTNELYVFWNTDGSTTVFSTSRMGRVSGTLHRGLIPAQPMGTRVHYYLSAMAGTGLISTEPATAPSELHSFDVTVTVSLLVTGTPFQAGTVAPDYGMQTIPSGSVVNATATPGAPAAGTRYAASGWTGEGSVPESGVGSSLSFTCRVDSVLDWQWTTQHELVQTSNVRGAVATSTWWFAGSTGETVVAPWSVNDQGTNYGLAYWQLDGARQPDATNPAVNPVPGVVMASPRVAAAVYLRDSVDSDGDDLSDWWELRYFGSLAPWRDDDPDVDGYSNLAEFRDRSNPRDAASIPVPPVVQHTALANPQVASAPWFVSATVTDNFMVASATLWWRRNGDAWQSAGMVSGGGDDYEAAIPGPAADGDTFTYRVEAADAAGLHATNGPHAFGVVLPSLTLDPTNMEYLVVMENSASNFVLQVGNAGAGALDWTARVVRVGLWDDVESGEGAWIHDGAGDEWHVSTNRSVSASHAWYAGSSATREYASGADSRLTSETVTLKTGAVLRFSHYMDSELKDGGYAYDGGVVELSVGGGAFVRIEPVGGYPFLIAGGTGGPFANGTPCFAGTGGWQTVEFDLAAYAGQSARFRFRFGSDSSKSREGWYVDDIGLYPATGDGSWLGMAPGEGSIAGPGTSNVVITLDSTGLPGGTLWPAEIGVSSTDPANPQRAIPLSMVVLGSASDFDGDGMPDRWEFDNGLNPLSALDALLDDDGDGFPNEQEFVAGTDPRDEESFFRMTGASQAGGRGVLFPGLSGRLYSLSVSSNFAGGAWNDLFTGVPGSNGVMSLVDTNSAATRFYRLGVEMAP